MNISTLSIGTWQVEAEQEVIGKTELRRVVNSDFSIVFLSNRSSLRMYLGHSSFLDYKKQMLDLRPICHPKRRQHHMLVENEKCGCLDIRNHHFLHLSPGTVQSSINTRSKEDKGVMLLPPGWPQLPPKPFFPSILFEKRP